MPPDSEGPPGHYGLDTTAKALYRKLREHLRKVDMWDGAYVDMLAQTCQYAMRSRQAWDALPKDKRGAPILTTQGRSENSGEVAHPLVRVAEAAAKSFVEGLKELGLTPLQRRRYEIEGKPSKGGKLGL